MRHADIITAAQDEAAKLLGCDAETAKRAVAKHLDEALCGPSDAPWPEAPEPPAPDASKEEVAAFIEAVELWKEEVARWKAANDAAVAANRRVMAIAKVLGIPNDRPVAQALGKAEMKPVYEGGPFSYTPERLIRSRDGKFVIENKNATVEYKIADLMPARRRKNVTWDRAERAAELAHFLVWLEDQRAKGRPEAELTFGACIRDIAPRP